MIQHEASSGLEPTARRGLLSNVAPKIAAVVIAVTLLPLGPLGTVASANTKLPSSAPFVSSPSSKTWYRIPAVIVNGQGHVLAFAERRDNDKIDMGNFDVVMRKSTDGGRTWGPLKTIANDGRNRVSNPVPLLDPKTGDVLLVTSIRRADDVYKGIFLQRSKDGGDTWSPLLSGEIRPEGPWKGGLTGPGHGIVIQNGAHKGRLVIAMGYKRTDYYGAYGIYSDDSGKSWQIGFDWADKSGSIAYIEGTMAELPCGGLHINYRDKYGTTPGHTRLVAESRDSGRTLSTGFRRSASLLMHSVQGAALNPKGTYQNTLLFSAPSHTTPRDRALRRDMSVFVSKDGGETFGNPYPVDLVSRPGAYSDMVQLSDGVVGILYETGNVKWRERIEFKQLSIADIMAPAKVSSSVTGKLSKNKIGRKSRAKVKTVTKVPGSIAPPGRVLVRYRSARKSGTVPVTLTFSNRGVKYVTLPRLPKGKYTISVTYTGNARIAAKTTSAGTLTVK